MQTENSLKVSSHPSSPSRQRVKVRLTAPQWHCGIRSPSPERRPSRCPRRPTLRPAQPRQPSRHDPAAAGRSDVGRRCCIVLTPADPASLPRRWHPSRSTVQSRSRHYRPRRLRRQSTPPLGAPNPRRHGLPRAARASMAAAGRLFCAPQHRARRRMSHARRCSLLDRRGCLRRAMRIHC